MLKNRCLYKLFYFKIELGKGTYTNYTNINLTGGAEMKKQAKTPAAGTEKRNKAGKAALDLLFFLAGSILYSIGIICFAAPNNIAPGGVSGLATVLNYLWQLPIGVLVLLINIPLLLLGWKKLGTVFIGKTAVATVILSVTLDVLALFMPKYTGDPLLASIYGGFMGGAGLALFFIRGATSGGTDIVVRLLQKKFPYLSTGRFVLLVDMAVVLFAAVVYWNVESALYAIIYLFISSQLIDQILFGQVNGKVLTIITTKGKEVGKMINTDFSRGVTVLHAKGGYTEEEKTMIYCAVRKNQVTFIVRAVREIDPKAFVVVSKADEIAGEFGK